MAAAEALLECASVGRTDNDRESAQWGSAEQTEAIELGDRGRLQYCWCELCIIIVVRLLIYENLLKFLKKSQNLAVG